MCLNDFIDLERCFKCIPYQDEFLLLVLKNSTVLLFCPGKVLYFSSYSYFLNFFFKILKMPYLKTCKLMENL